MSTFICSSTVECPNNPSFDSRFVSQSGSWCILNTPEWAHDDRLRRLHDALIIILLSHSSQFTASKWSLPIALCCLQVNNVWSGIIIPLWLITPHQNKIAKKNQIVLFLMIYCNKPKANKAHAMQILAHYCLSAAPSCLFVSTCEHNSYPFAWLSLSEFICKHLWLRIKAIVKF